MKLISLNRNYVDEKNNFLGGEIIFNDDLSLDYEVKYLSKEQMKDLYFKYKDSKEHILDFKMDDNSIMCDMDVINNITTLEEFNDLEDIEIYSNELSLLSLFADIVKDSGILVRYEESKMDFDLFQPKFSNSSMTVGQSVLTEDGWRFKKFIYVEKGRLMVNGFKFAIPKDLLYKYKKYGLNVVDEIEKSDVNYCVLEFKNNMLSVYAYDFKVIFPNGNMNRQNSEMEFLLSNKNNSLFLINSFKKEPDLEKRDDYQKKDVSVYNNLYINIKPIVKRVSKKERVAFYEDIKSNLLPYLKNGGNLKSYIYSKFAVNSGDYILRRYAYKDMFIKISNNNSISHMLEKCMKMDKKTNELLVLRSIIVYAVRTNLFLHEEREVLETLENVRNIYGGCTHIQSELVRGGIKYDTEFD